MIKQLFFLFFYFQMNLIRDEGSISVMPYILGIVILMVLIFIRKQNTSFAKVCVVLLGMYFLILLNKTIFPIFISGNFVEIMRDSPDKRYIELLPLFITLRYDQSFSYYLPIIFNILLTIPLGFILSCLMPNQLKKILFLSFLVTLSIETLQLVISLILRYPHRIFDINDILLNMLGAFLGYYLYILIAKVLIKNK